MKIKRIITKEDCDRLVFDRCSDSTKPHINEYPKCPGPDSKDCPLENVPDTFLAGMELVTNTQKILIDKDKELARLKEMLIEERARSWISESRSMKPIITPQHLIDLAREQIEKELKEKKTSPPSKEVEQTKAELREKEARGEKLDPMEEIFLRPFEFPEKKEKSE